MNRTRITVIFLIFSLFLVLTANVCAAHEETSGDKYFTLVDENNNVVHRTGLKVNVDDEYISADNARYKVVEVTGQIARCIYQGEEKMPIVNYDKQKSAWVFTEQEVPVASGSQKPLIAVYHTHSDESYVPTDGKESINGNGGIYDVGQAFVDELERVGFQVEYSENNHNPHDVNAYNRSRRTATQLMKQQPAAIIDVHRDAVPADEYAAEVEGQEVTKVKLVVGKQNPNMKTNLEFAKKIKAVMDKKEPGLSNGIFIGKGDYNQDLNPRAMLIEVGSHTNSKEDAQQGAKLFADTMQAVMGLSSNAPAAKPLGNDNQGSFQVIAVIIAILAAAGGGFYLLNKGSKSQ